MIDELNETSERRQLCALRSHKSPHEPSRRPKEQFRSVIRRTLIGDWLIDFDNKKVRSCGSTDSMGHETRSRCWASRLNCALAKCVTESIERDFARVRSPRAEAGTNEIPKPDSKPRDNFEADQIDDDGHSRGEKKEGKEKERNSQLAADPHSDISFSLRVLSKLSTWNKQKKKHIFSCDFERDSSYVVDIKQRRTRNGANDCMHQHTPLAAALASPHHATRRSLFTKQKWDTKAQRNENSDDFFGSARFAAFEFQSFEGNKSLTRSFVDYRVAPRNLRRWSTIASLTASLLSESPQCAFVRSRVFALLSFRRCLSFIDFDSRARAFRQSMKSTQNVCN